MEYTEVLDKQITRKQHYVPKAYLKNFSVSNQKSEQVYLLISNRIDLLSYIDFSIDAEKEDDEQVYQLLHTDKETALKQYEDMMSSKEIKYWR